MEDKLTDFDKDEYIRQLHRSRTMVILIFSILSFVIGFLVARVIYTHHHLAGLF
jgi:hypothetical protein